MYSLEVYIKSFGGQKNPLEPPPAYGPDLVSMLEFILIPHLLHQFERMAVMNLYFLCNGLLTLQCQYLQQDHL